MMKDTKRKVLEMRYMHEESKLHTNGFLFRNTMDKFDNKDIKDAFLALRYLNSVIETVINRQGITENDLDEDDRPEYLFMKEANSLSEVLEKLVAALPDEDLSEGSE